MQYRKWMHYPPHAVLANIIIQSPRLEEAAGWATSLGKCFAAMPLEHVRVLGPASAPIVRIKRIYRFHLLLKAAQRQPWPERCGQAWRRRRRWAFPAATSLSTSTP